MGRINGWKLVSKGKYRIRYENKGLEAHHDVVHLNIYKVGPDPWVVQEYIPGTMLFRELYQSHSKEKAVAFAKKYMRRHPNG